MTDPSKMFAVLTVVDPQQQHAEVYGQILRDPSCPHSESLDQQIRAYVNEYIDDTCTVFMSKMDTTIPEDFNGVVMTVCGPEGGPKYQLTVKQFENKTGRRGKHLQRYRELDRTIWAEQRHHFLNPPPPPPAPVTVWGEKQHDIAVKSMWDAIIFVFAAATLIYLAVVLTSGRRDD